VDGVENTWLLSGATIHALLDQLAMLRQAREFKERLRQIFNNVRLPDRVAWTDIEQQVMQLLANDYHERIQQQSSQMKQTLGYSGEVAQRVIQWLIHYKVIFRGVNLHCPSCQTEQWLDIDELSSAFHCIGCQQSVGVPLSIDSTTWKYRINTLYARAVEQGVLPHLFTVNYFLIAGGYQGLHVDSSIIGAFPGLKLRAKEGASVPRAEMEIDVAWIADGGLYIGECKTNGRELTIADVDRYFHVAQALQCQQVVFSILDDLDSLAPETRALLSNPPVPTVLLSRDELLDQYPGKATRVQANKEGTQDSVLSFEHYLVGFPFWFESLEQKSI